MHDNDLPELGDIGQGHNHPPTAAQWQTPHLPAGTKVQVDDQRDADLVEASFVEGFEAASDPTSFLRLAGIPFEAANGQGQVLRLLRVNLDRATDVGSVTPHLGGGSYRYDPLPAKMVSTRQALRFVYHDGDRLIMLSFAEARALSAAGGAAMPSLGAAEQKKGSAD